MAACSGAGSSPTSSARRGCWRLATIGGPPRSRLARSRWCGRSLSALGPSESIEDFDAVVIDGVPAGAFAPGALARIAGAVSSRKTGLFLANGHHAGSPLSATTLMLYDETPLEPLLPLASEARARQAGPPPRHLVMLMDTSGSMCGGPLTTAQQIAVSIVNRYLRPHDLLDLMAFTTSASARLTDEPMTPQGKARAMDEIRRMSCDGGTDPQEALQQLAARRLKNCGLLFFSDGGFGPLRQLSQYRPDCRTTVFGIRPEPFSPNEPMSALADPIHVDSGFDPQRIKIPYFDQDAKNHFFEPGSYTALSMKHVLPSGFAMEVPEIPLEGSATTSPKDDVVPVAVRPKLTDPVLAYRESGTANVGELTTAFPPAWIGRADGRAAIRQWIEAVLPSVSSRRYTFQLTEQGNDLEIDIALAPEGNRLPEVERIDASVEMPGAPALEVSVRRDEEAPATFRARLTLSAAVRPPDRRDARAERVGSGCARPAAAHPDARAAAAAALRTPCRRVVQLRTERAAAARDGEGGKRQLRCGRAHDGRSHRSSPAAASISGRSRRRSAASAISRRSSRGGWIHDRAGDSTSAPRS